MAMSEEYKTALNKHCTSTSEDFEKTCAQAGLDPVILKDLRELLSAKLLQADVTLFLTSLPKGRKSAYLAATLHSMAVGMAAIITFREQWEATHANEQHSSDRG